MRKGNFLIDQKEIDTSFLRYDFFIGDIMFNLNNQKIFIEDIPLFDFVLCLNTCLENFKQGAVDDSIELTESDEKIFFRRNSEIIIICFSFSTYEFMVELSEFKTSVQKLAKKMVDDIENSIPAIQKNESYNYYRAQLSWAM